MSNLISELKEFASELEYGGDLINEAISKLEKANLKRVVESPGDIQCLTNMAKRQGFHIAGDTEFQIQGDNINVTRITFYKPSHFQS